MKFTYEFSQLRTKWVPPYKSDFKFVESVETPDDYTVRIRYSQPYFKALSIWMMGILPEHLWKDEKDPMRSRLNKLPVGTGPYRMTQPSGSIGGLSWRPMRPIFAIRPLSNDKSTII